MSPEQVIDAIDGGTPEEAAQALLGQLQTRAAWEREIAEGQRKKSADALECAAQHDERAKGFDVLVAALETVIIVPTGKAGK